MNTNDFAQVSHWLEWQKANENKGKYFDLAERQLALGEKRHAFDRYKFELNVADLALKHAAALQLIHRDSTLNIQERIRAAREKLFGPALTDHFQDPSTA